MAVELSQNRRRLIGRLQHRRQRAREGAVLVEGVRAVREALAAGAEVSFAVVSGPLAASPDDELLGELRRTARDVVRVDEADMRRLADTEHPQGVLLVCREPRPDGALLPSRGAVLVLDAVQDPGNVGTLVRSAVAFGFGCVIGLEGTADPWSPKAVRASAGTAFRIPIRSASVQEATEAFRDRGADVLVASSEGCPASEAFRRDVGVCALVIGNEGAGARDALRAAARTAVAVPMTGAVESLNAGVAGSILMYEWNR